MLASPINLKYEQQASLARPRLKYSLSARFFFFALDFVTGRRITLAKAKLLELLASIPYRQWEIKQYDTITHCFRNTQKVNLAESVIEWGRNAQDNEYDHLQVIHQKMKEDELKDPWYLWPPITFLIVFTYVIISKLLALINIKSAFHFNAEFEDHAEHVYAQMVSEHPEWEKQQVTNELVKRYADVDTWADVFRRVGLDERDHRNDSFIFCGKPEYIVSYEGMPSRH